MYNQRIYAGSIRGSFPSPNKWCAPPEGLIKINTNASLSEEGMVGLSVVERDGEGKVLFAVVRITRTLWPPDVAEAKAIHLDVGWVKKQGFKDLVIESDAQDLISRLSRASIYFSDLDAILGDIIFIRSSFRSFSFSHVRRGGNFVAHHLAKVVSFGYEQYWVNHCLGVVSPYVLMDTLSID